MSSDPTELDPGSDPGRTWASLQQPEQETSESTAQATPSPIHQSLEQLRQSPTKTARAANLKQLLQTHAQHTPDDGRVKHDPVTGLFKGEYFKDDDPLHQAALSSVPLQQKSTLYHAQKAIAKKEPMHISYGAAQASPAVVPSLASRRKEYAEAPSAGRPEEKQQVSGHSFLPTAVGITFGKEKGAPNKGFVQGISASALASNAQHLNDALGESSPYHQKLDGPKFGADLAGYIRNVNNGYHGDGSGPVTGTADVEVKPGKNYDGYRLTEHEANFLNAAFHNIGAQGKGETGRIAKELKRAQGHEVGEEGETNPLRAKINQLENAKRTFFPGQPEGEEPRKPWTHEMLEPTIRHFAGDLIHEIHHDPKEMAEELRPPPGTHRIESVFAKEGIPRKEMVAAHVMPPKKEPGEAVYWVNIDQLEQHLKKETA